MMNEALALVRKSDFNGARVLCEALLAEDDDNVDALHLLGVVELKTGRRSEACALLDRAVALRPDFAIAHFHAAQASFGGEHKGMAKARHHFREALKYRPNWFEALYGLGRCCSAIGPIEEAVECYREAVRLRPGHAEASYRLSECLSQIDCLEEAHQYLERAVSLNADVAPTARDDLTELKASIRETRRESRPLVRKARYPDTADIQGKLRETVLRDVVGDVAGAPTFGASSRIFTMGSCFARNIVRHLRSCGYKAGLLDISEYINSTYANRYFVDWLKGDLEGDVKERIEALLQGKNTREGLFESLRQADVFIFTLGVAPCFFERGTGQFIMPRPSAINSRALAERFDFRTTTVEENVSNVLYVIDYIRSINPGVKIVLTLSPVPLHASFEFQSAVVADCISKSILRVAAHTIMSMGQDNIYYWPSFEIVRWLGAHTGPVYGVDDGASWHVSEDLIGMIVDLFVEVHGGRKGSPAPVEVPRTLPVGEALDQ